MTNTSTLTRSEKAAESIAARMEANGLPYESSRPGSMPTAPSGSKVPVIAYWRSPVDDDTRYFNGWYDADTAVEVARKVRRMKGVWKVVIVKDSEIF